MGLMRQLKTHFQRRVHVEIGKERMHTSCLWRLDILLLFSIRFAQNVAIATPFALTSSKALYLAIVAVAKKCVFPCSFCIFMYISNVVILVVWLSKDFLRILSHCMHFTLSKWWHLHHMLLWFTSNSVKGLIGPVWHQRHVEPNWMLPWSMCGLFVGQLIHYSYLSISKWFGLIHNIKYCEVYFQLMCEGIKIYNWLLSSAQCISWVYYSNPMQGCLIGWDGHHVWQLTKGRNIWKKLNHMVNLKIWANFTWQLVNLIWLARISLISIG